jgi:acyl-[acyl-carrier-protein]-phospholipid O-acyltransferase/long-chain-fatty-acid--[acyl-carrier-protein] ligase
MQLHQRFIEVAKQYPNKVAVYDTATRKEVTYGNMLIASLLMAKKFSQYNSLYLGIMVPTSAGCMIAFMATLMAGKVPVMINYSTGAIENSKYAQMKCGFKKIIVSRKLMEKLNLEPISGMIYLEDLLPSITALDKMRAFMTSKMPLSLVKNSVYKGSDDDTAVILFTSGSEKEPKAVQLAHRNLNHNVTHLPGIINVTNEDSFVGALPLFHVYGLTITFLLPMLIGASVVTHANPLDYKYIVETIKKYELTILITTPTFLHGYLKKAQHGDMKSLRVVIAGADKMPDNLRKRYLEEQGIDVLEGYGTTETSPVISTNVPGSNRHGSIGQPAPEVEVKIVHHETGDEMPVGETGKILVKGDLVMKGYLGDLEETSLRIHNGWYDTGDMGKLDEDGYLWHQGRLKRFVKIGGEMVSLVKVEAVLEHHLPPNAKCCVVDVPNPTKGADIVAALTTDEIDTKKIIKLLKKELPSIAIPREFHVIEDLPMMPSGKVNFREVEKICRSYHTDDE